MDSVNGVQGLMASRDGWTLQMVQEVQWLGEMAGFVGIDGLVGEFWCFNGFRCSIASDVHAASSLLLPVFLSLGAYVCVGVIACLLAPLMLTIVKSIDR
jgi:hypothetical protein